MQLYFFIICNASHGINPGNLVMSTRSQHAALGLDSRMVELEPDSRLANQRTSGPRFHLAHRRTIVQSDPVLVFILDTDVAIIITFQPPISNPSLISNSETVKVPLPSSFRVHVHVRSFGLPGPDEKP